MYRARASLIFVYFMTFFMFFCNSHGMAKELKILSKAESEKIWSLRDPQSKYELVILDLPLRDINTTKLGILKSWVAKGNILVLFVKGEYVNQYERGERQGFIGTEFGIKAKLDSLNHYNSSTIVLQSTAKHILLTDVKRLIAKNYSMSWGFPGQRSGYTQVVFSGGYDIPLLKWPDSEANRYGKVTTFIAGVLSSYGAGFVLSYPNTIISDQYDGERFFKNVNDFASERRVLAPGGLLPATENKGQNRFDTAITADGDFLSCRLLDSSISINVGGKLVNFTTHKISKFFLSGHNNSHITLFLLDGKKVEGKTPIMNFNLELIGSGSIKIKRQELNSLFIGVFK